MLELVKQFLQKLDFVSVAEFLRKRNNRKAAARLHLILVRSYDVLEIYRIILNELRAALDTYEGVEGAIRFHVNPARIAHLLNVQAMNLEIIEQLTIDLFREIKILDHRFEKAYRELIPHKFGILFEAQGLLGEGRLPLHEGNPNLFPKETNGPYRTLWFTSNAPEQDRQEIEKYLYGWTKAEDTVMDVNFYDGEKFFNMLKWYFESKQPLKALQDLEEVTESYKQALISNFTLEELLSEIRQVDRHDHWVR